MKRCILLLISSGLLLTAQADDRQLSKLQYWFDDNQSAMTEQTLSGTKQTINEAVDASSLREGMHTLYFRIGDTAGQWTPLQTWSFFVAPIRDKGAKAIKAVEYWMDNDFAKRKTTEISGNIWQQALDVSDLSEGIHKLNYRFVDNYDSYGPVSQAMFSKVQKKATQIKKLRYWWSNRTDMIEEVDADQPSFTYESLLKVPEYARQDGLTNKGVARFNCVAVDDQGRQSASFYEDVIYATGPELTADRYSATIGTSVKLSWTYSDANGVKDYIVYYSKDNGPYVMYIPSTNATSTEFKGNKGAYRFLVVARNNAGQRTSMDDEWTVLVIFE